MSQIRWYHTHLFLRELVRLHGVLKNIISDKDAKLVSHIWKFLSGKIGTKLLFSTTCHRQTDGQQRCRTLSQLLRTIISKNFISLKECLSFIEFAYTRSIHSTTCYSPFEILDEFNPLKLLDFLPLPVDESVSPQSKCKSDLVKSIHEKAQKHIQKIE